MPLVDAAFESQQAITGAVEQLLQFGFPRSAIYYDADDRFRAPPDAMSRETGLLSTVSTFFAKLGGSDSDSKPLAAAYAEVIRRGGMILSVETSTAIEEQTAKIVFQRAGAVDIDARSRQLEGEQAADMLHAEPLEDSQADSPESRAVTVAGIPLYNCPARAVALDLPRPATSADGDWGPRGAAATESDLAAFQPGTFEVRQSVETLTIDTQARVIEELTVNKSVIVYREAVSDTVRRTVVDVERDEAAAGSAVGH